MKCAEDGIGRWRQNVSTAKIRVIDVKIGRVCRTANLRYVRRRTISNVIPVDTGEPGMVLEIGKAILTEPVLGTANQLTHQILAFLRHI